MSINLKHASFSKVKCYRKLGVHLQVDTLDVLQLGLQRGNGCLNNHR